MVHEITLKMQSLKVMCRTSLNRTRFFFRSTNTTTNALHAENPIMVEENVNSRTIFLNRHRFLNAIDNTMIIRLNELYRAWETDPEVGFLVLKGNGRAFCAGGDLLTVHRLITEGKKEECKEYIRRMYGFMHLQSTYLKPHVAILDGITMGGGAGISVHGAFRVATNNTIFAMPEVRIGFHPDVGSSYFLSRLPGHLGEYLGLTGDSLRGEEMAACGLATHYINSAKLLSMEYQLGKFIDGADFSAMESFLARFSEYSFPHENSVLHRIEMVNKCFGCSTIEQIINTLESEVCKTNEEWMLSTLKRLREAPPLSLKISLRSIQEARNQTLSQCLAREYRITSRAISGNISSDLVEGIRARLVDKCLAPQWDPSSLERVSEEMVDAYFAPLDENEPELELPPYRLHTKSA